MGHYKNSLFFHWALLFFYSLVNGYTLYNLCYSWPTTGSMVWFILIFSCPAFLYQFIFITYSLKFKKNLQWKYKLRFISLVLGFFVAGGLLQQTQKSSLRKMTRAYQPVVARILEQMPTPSCEDAYFDTLKTVKYNGSIHRMIAKDGHPIGELLYNHERFLIHFRGGSIDIAGSTLFYDSKVKHWQLFHNDNLEAFTHFKTLIDPLTLCEIF